MLEELSGVQRSKDAYSGVFKRARFFVDDGVKGKSGVQTLEPTLHLGPNSSSKNTNNGYMTDDKKI